MVARTQPRRFIASLLQGLWWPTFFGVSAAVGVYFALAQGWLAHPSWRRYLAGHPIEYAEVTLFLVGLSGLVIRAWDIARQYPACRPAELPPRGATPQDVSAAARLIEHVQQWPRAVRDSWMAQRLAQALAFVHQQQSAENLDEHLQTLAQEAEDRDHDSLALVRIIIWATPMLGFLGTVMGITLALDQLSPQALVANPDDAMDGLLAALAVAFDTTALALVMSIILMFVMFLIGQPAGDLLRDVDQRARTQLATRFEVPGTARDPQVAILHQLTHQMASATQTLVERQSEIWRESFDRAGEHWLAAASGAAHQLEDGLRNSLQQSLHQHAQSLGQIHDQAQQQAERWWDQLQTALQHNGSMLTRQQQELHRLGEVMGRVVEAAGEVSKLEHVLNSNLKALAGAKNFEDTVMSLSAAIHLLNCRVSPASRATDVAKLEGQGKAA